MGQLFKSLKILFLLSFSVLSFDVFSEKKQPLIIHKGQEQVKLDRAQAWFEKMIQKYPDLQDCADIRFTSFFDRWCIYIAYLDGKKCIGYPREKDFIGFTEEDEFALLHECGHLKNYKYSSFLIDELQQEKIAKVCLAGALLSLSGAALSQVSDCKSMKNEIKIYDYRISQTFPVLIGALGLNYWLYKKMNRKAVAIVKLQIGKVDENWADQYAYKHADKHALQGGYQMFMKNFISCKKKLDDRLGKKMSIWMLRWIMYFLDTHKLSLDRANEIKKVLYKRFNYRISKEIEQLYAV